MENKIQVFNNPKFGDLHGYLDEKGTAHFNAEDVSRGLGFTQMKNGVEYVKWERVNSYLAEFGFSPQVGKGDFIPENMVYRLAMKANNETAKDFQSWLADDVVPNIRKTGGYSLQKDDVEVYKKIVADPDFLIQIAMTIKTANEKVEKLTTENAVLNQQVAELTPKATYCSVVLNCKDLVSVSKIAKDYGMSATEMNKLLHNLGVQYKQSEVWLLYQKYAKLGWTSTKTITYPDNEGFIHSKVHTYWTPKGRLGLYHLLKENGYLPKIELK